MTRPAPGAAVVERDARTIPRCERRDGRHSGHANSTTNFVEEPKSEITSPEIHRGDGRLILPIRPRARTRRPGRRRGAARRTAHGAS